MLLVSMLQEAHTCNLALGLIPLARPLTCADATALFGKWHLGFYQRAYTPLARGFDEHIGYFQGHIDYYTHQGFAYGGAVDGLDWHRGNETPCFNDTGTYTSELVTQTAVDFLNRKAADPSTPWFLYLPFHLLHEPNQVPDKFLALYPEAGAPLDWLCGIGV